LTLRDGRLAAAGQALVDALRARAAFSRDTVAVRAEGSALGQPLRLGLTVRDPASPRVVAAIEAGAELGRLAELGLLPDTLGLTGAVDIDVRTELEIADPRGARATGTIELGGVAIAGMNPAVAIPAATFRFEGGRLAVRPLRLALGPDGAPVELEATVEGWIPALVDSAAPPPRVVATLDADTLDLDALLGPSRGVYPPLLFARLRDRPIDGRSAAESAREAGLTLPPLPAVDARVRADVGLLVRNGLRYHDLTATVQLRPDAVELESARFGLLGGRVEATGRLEPVPAHTGAAAPADTTAGARLIARYAVENVGAEPFFDRLTPFRDHLTGSLDLVGTVGATLDRHLLPDRNTFSADGTLAIADGRLAGWRVLEAVAARLGLPAYDTLRFDDWAGSFRVAGPLVTLDETVLRGRELDMRAAGSFDLGGRMDLGATLYLSRELARRAGEVGSQVVAAAGTDGRVPVGVTITGPVEEPAVRLDLSEARSAVVERAREAAAAEARRAADRVARAAAGEVAGRLELPDSLRGLPPDSLRAVLGDSLFGLLPDSLKLPADSLAARAENALKARLRKLLPGGGD
ncbi:MAG: AsmA-like C-terminal region-containing protein, partial [Gemmatimonadota bacterium]